MMNSKDRSIKQEEQPKTIGFRFAAKMTKEVIDEKIAKYTSEGWDVQSDDNYLGFISPCGGWFHSYNKETSQGMFINKKWIENMKLLKRKDEQDNNTSE